MLGKLRKGTWETLDNIELLCISQSAKSKRVVKGVGYAHSSYDVRRQQNFDGAKGHYFNFVPKGRKDWEIAQKAINSCFTKGSGLPAGALSEGKAKGSEYL